MPDGLWPGSRRDRRRRRDRVRRARRRSIGKPEPVLVQTALDRLGPGRALMVGDRVDADLARRHAAGIDGAIVLTGASDRAAAEAATRSEPVAIADGWRRSSSG